jgi:hypothetical protein
MKQLNRTYLLSVVLFFCTISLHSMEKAQTDTDMLSTLPHDILWNIAAHTNCDSIRSCASASKKLSTLLNVNSFETALKTGEFIISDDFILNPQYKHNKDGIQEFSRYNNVSKQNKTLINNNKQLRKFCEKRVIECHQEKDWNKFYAYMSRLNSLEELHNELAKQPDITPLTQETYILFSFACADTQLALLILNKAWKDIFATQPFLYHLAFITCSTARDRDGMSRDLAPYSAGKKEFIEDLIKTDVHALWLQDNKEKASSAVLNCKTITDTEKFEILDIIFKTTNVSAQNSTFAHNILLPVTSEEIICNFINYYKPSYLYPKMACSLLCDAISSDLLNVVKTILNTVSPKESKELINKQDASFPYPPLLLSINNAADRQKNGTAILTLLLERNECLDTADHKGSRALHYLCYRARRIPNIVFYIEYIVTTKKWDINAKNNLGQTPLIMACEYDAPIETIKFLLNLEGIDVEHADNNGNTALDYAISRGITDEIILQKLGEK